MCLTKDRHKTHRLQVSPEAIKMAVGDSRSCYKGKREKKKVEGEGREVIGQYDREVGLW